MSREIYTARDLVSKLVGNITQTLSKKMGINKGWSSIVDVKLAERSFVKDIVGDCIHICVRDSGSKQLLLLKKREILSAISKNYPGLDIKKIEFHFQ